MWMVVHIAKSQVAAENIRDSLTEEGLMVRLRPVYRERSSEENYYEIRVLESESREARAILLEKGL